LGAGAEAKLAKKRVLLRITIIGKSGAGKTSLINALVNNAYTERYHATENFGLYYAVLSVTEEDSEPGAPKFNVLLEIEDTPGSELLDKELLDLFDPWWPKPQELAMKRPPRSSKRKGTDEEDSAHLPFSIVYAPVGKYNDEEAPVTECEIGINAGKWFCNRPDNNCGAEVYMPDAPHGTGRQCRSCRRFQSSLTPKGEFRPIVRQRMAYIFLFDATDKESYLEALRVYNEYQTYLSKKDIKQKPLVYLVGTKTDKEPEMKKDKDDAQEQEFQKHVVQHITQHMKSFAQKQSDDLKQLSTNTVSSAQFRNVTELFRGIVRDLRVREPLWKLNPLGETTDEEADASTCSVQ